jgi:hypothetical protein
MVTDARRAGSEYRAIARGAVSRAAMRVRGGFHNGARIVPYREGERGNRVIRRLIEAPGPTMVTRYGDVELTTLASLRSHAGPDEIRARLVRLHRSAGFFPPRVDLLPRFLDVYERSARRIDCLGIWNFENGRWAIEERMFRDYSPHAALVSIRSLESWLYREPWTQALRGKRVLVVHPFDRSIRSQYAKRTRLFADERVLPELASLDTVRAVQTVAGTPSPYATWFDALDAMREQVEAVEFDVAIIGAGAYGLPLAAHVKDMGRKAVHMGGVTQILFGIAGSRWERRIPGGYPPLTRFMNEHWTRPLPEETPAGFRSVDEGAYW